MGGPDGALTPDGALDAIVRGDAPLGCPYPLTDCNTFTCGATCYMFCPYLQVWGDARTQCALWGGCMATIPSGEISTCLGEVGTGWFGLHQPIAGPEGPWMWDCSDTSSFTDWAVGQPDDGLSAIIDEDCGELRTDGDWNDADCAVGLPFFCGWTP